MKVNYETGFQIGVMEARLKKMRKQRDEYKKQRDELIVDIGKLRERNKDLEKKASAWDRYCKSVEKDLINEFGNDDERVKFGMELNNKIFTEDDTNG
ncbi:acetyltransferase (GNAT) family protein [Staphylococcus aureus]|nr:acetyltransferase GNAT family protein [Staphylococcus aureus]GBT44802.1 acetyltransferase GNAT family protein [Staphylococcus aureus]GBT47884.1 acetyltransferase GNAT family protein [Staphylococcus aureus]GBT68079.1 acetyltransferase GNAT family protein [Staphylococcus aureus]GBV29503.1 acetyltransferase (GNAT) family protein [Staphylococcus aureus]